MSKILNLNKNVIANKVKQSDEIATPCGLAMTGECGRSSPTCHPWTSVSEIRGSTWCSFNAPRYAQSGRSMVEMLGVLAVMGVLSVAGIAGYNSAMNRHRANELLNEASKRATVVAAQAMQGRETFSINEFPNNEALKFSTEVTHDKTNGQFTLEIGGVSEAVCQQMKNAMGPVIRKFEPAACADDATVKLTFNDDMSTTAKACDYNDDSDACDSAGYHYCADNTCRADCCAGVDTTCQTCATDGTITNKTGNCTTDEIADGYCKAGTCTEKPDCSVYPGTDVVYTGGAAGLADDGETTCRCESGYKWDTAGEQCVVATENSACAMQDDCGGSNSDYYCQYTDYDQCVEDTLTAMGCTGTTADTCSKPGTCKSVGGSKSITAAQLSTLTSAGFANTIEASAGSMNWWSAVNWCQAKGKPLIGVEDLNVYRSGTMTQVVENTAGSFGCASGKTCSGWNGNPYNAMWSGNTVTDAADASGEKYRDKYSAKLVALRQVFGTPYFWTKSKYYNNSPCSVFGVSLARSDVDLANPSRTTGRFGDYYALCK